MYFVASTFSFRILYAYNYNSACTVSELSETDNIKEQMDSELESMRSFSLLSLFFKLELIAINIFPTSTSNAQGEQKMR